MSENGKDFRIINEKPRSRKLNPRVDLSAMVSISFLLIVFFMVNAEMSKPQVMNLGMPSTGDITCGGFNDSFGYKRVVTLLLDDNNKIISYRGLLDFSDELPKTLSYGKDGIRKSLLSQNKDVLEMTGDRKKGTIVIIKPSKKSNYGNLVDILDEMTISNIYSYAIVNDYTPAEMKLLASR